MNNHNQHLPADQYKRWETIVSESFPEPTPTTELQCPHCGATDLLSEYAVIVFEGSPDGFECPSQECRRFVHYDELPEKWAEYRIRQEFDDYDDDKRNEWLINKWMD